MHKVEVLHYNKEYDIEISFDERNKLYYFNKIGISADMLKQICQGKVGSDFWYKFKWEEDISNYWIEKKLDENWRES